MRLAQHSHAAYTVATVLSGRLEIEIGGHARASLGAGETALIGIDEPHAAQLEQCELLSVAIRPLALDELLVELGWQHPFAAPVFLAPVVTDAHLHTLAHQITSELVDERPGQGTMIDALVQQLGVYLLRTQLRVRRTASIERTRYGPVDRRLRRAVELMHTHLATELSLADLAEAVALSPSHFAHLFKELLGLTPHAYLTNLRLERARALLAESDLPITEIAGRVGFRSSGHFASAFKATTGVAPRDFRASASASDHAAAAPEHTC